MRSPGSSSKAPCSIGSIARPAMPGSPRSPNASRSMSPTMRRSRSSARRSGIGLVVVGPEAPLVAGHRRRSRGARHQSVRAEQAAARLEGSKGFTKDLCARNGIPTAAYRRFDDAEDAKAYLEGQTAPSRDQGGWARGRQGRDHRRDVEPKPIAAIDDCFAGAFGAAGAEFVIEEFLQGEEASFFALVDGTNALPLATAQDHKRAFDGDQGPNTGGMGAYSPAPIVTDAVCAPRHERDHRADGARDAEERHAVQRRALCRADDRERGAEAHRI